MRAFPLPTVSTTYNENYVQIWANHFSTMFPGTSFSGPSNFIRDRSNWVLGELGRLAPEIVFEITTGGGANFNVNQSTVTLTGNAWYRVRDIFIQGRPEPLQPTWIDADTWRIEVPLVLGANVLNFQAFDYQGNLTDSDSITVTTTVGSPVQQSLRVSELMFNPTGSDEAEFIELVNVSPTDTLDLTGLEFTTGVNYTFESGSLAPGERIVVARNPSALVTRYGGSVSVVGPFAEPATGLSNRGESITLVDAVGGEIQTFTYDDVWYPETDGGGFSLVVVDANSADLNDWNDPSGWRVSYDTGGSPALPDFIAGDLDQDNQVGLRDLALLQGHLGMTGGATRTDGDLNYDGAVTRADLVGLLENLGRVSTLTAGAPDAGGALAAASANPSIAPESGVSDSASRSPREQRETQRRQRTVHRLQRLSSGAVDRALTLFVTDQSNSSLAGGRWRSRRPVTRGGPVLRETRKVQENSAGP